MKISSRNTFVSALILASSLSSPALLSAGVQEEKVDEKALYDLAPAGSAFIRLINLQSGNQALNVNGLALSSSGYCSAGNYQYLPSGQYTVEFEDQSLTIDLAENLAYSLVLEHSGLTLRNDPRSQNKRRGLVSVYNLSSLDGLSVKTSDGKLALFANIQSGEIKSRAINPVRVDLSVFHDQTRLMDTETVIFERGVISSLLICGEQNAEIATWVRQ